VAKKLKKTYFIILLPAVVGLIAGYAAKSYNFLAVGQFQFRGIIALFVFILSVIFAVALPIFYRTLFAHRVRHLKNLSEKKLIKFELNLLYLALVTPYLTLIAFLLELPRFHLAGTVLMALYAVYYYYPSRKRIRFEKRIFRVIQ
jgi:hypothetical protein